jgi:hypothetical protein
MRILITDILSLFNGPVELDELPTMNLKHLGGSLIPGGSNNRISIDGFQTTDVFDSNQRKRENGEQFHEWFPGFYVLDGRLDVKHSAIFLKFLMLVILPLVAYLI